MNNIKFLDNVNITINRKDGTPIIIFEKIPFTCKDIVFNGINNRSATINVNIDIDESLEKEVADIFSKERNNL